LGASGDGRHLSFTIPVAMPDTAQNGTSGKVTKRDSIKKVKFGTSDMMVSELCIGTMTWGSFVGCEEDVFAQLDAAIAHGANFIDNAEMYPVAFNYGKTSEAWLGKWLNSRVSTGKLKRPDIYLATKCNPLMIGGTAEGETPKPHGYETDILERSCRASIERMQCDYIDLYQLHWPSRDVPVFGCLSFYPDGHNRAAAFTDKIAAGEGGMSVFERQVLSVKRLLDLGLIKYWGLSNENAYGITMFCLACDKLGVPRPISCQNDFSLLNRSYELDTWEAAYRFGLVGLPYGVLAGGVLSGKYFDGSKWAREADADRPIQECRHRRNPEFQPRYGMPVAMQATAEYVKLAEHYGISPMQLAVAWALHRPCNTAIISGTCTVKQMEEYVSAFKLDLPTELLDEVDKIHEQFRSPSMWLHNKEVCQKAEWLGPDKRSASEPIAVKD